MARYGDCAVFQTQTGLDVVLDSEGPVLEVATVNRGPSVMYDVCLRMEGPWGRETTLVRPELAVDETNRVRFRLDDTARGRGAFPIVVWTDFRDDGRLPVTLCAVTVWPEPEKDDQAISADCSDVTVVRMETLSCDIVNTGGTARTVNARLLLPGDLGVENGSRTVSLGAFEKDEIHFKVMNRFASPGDNPAAYLVLEYDENGTHHSRVERPVIHIGDHNREKKAMGRVLWIMFMVTGLVWLGFVIVNKRPGRS